MLADDALSPSSARCAGRWTITARRQAFPNAVSLTRRLRRCLGARTVSPRTAPENSRAGSACGLLWVVGADAWRDMTYIPLIRSWLSRLALCGGLVLPIAAAAQPPAAPSQAAEQPGDPRQSAARAAVEGATVDAPPATLTFQNRPITELRATVLSCTPAMRAQAAERFLSDLVDRPASGPARARPLAGAVMIAVGDTDVFALVPADADPLGGRTLDETAANAVAALQVALDETTELRNPRRILTGAGLCARGHGGARVTALWADPRKASARGAPRSGRGPATAATARK